MYLFKKKSIYVYLLTSLVVIMISFAYIKANYLTTNRDTKIPPESVKYEIVNKDEYELLHETNTLIYYYREDRDVIMIKDKRSGYTWKTGLDIPFGSDISQAVLEAETLEEKLEIAIPQEDRMNTTYTGMANSIITVEYDEEGAIKFVSSASKDYAESELYTLNDNPSTRMLAVKFTNIELELKVYITFEEDSIIYEVRDEDLQGKGRNKILSLSITPFLGASGGTEKYYNPETDMYDIIKKKYMVPGYIFVPDGSGSLIRFNDNSASFSMYYGDVYGEDLAQSTYYNSRLTDAIPLKNPVMPVFGVAHGNKQAAFVAYADSAAEYMQIAVRPEENLTSYNYVYPRFVYNTNYFQIFNKKADGFFTLMKEPNKMDIKLTYSFLAGDGSNGNYPADYTGMALKFRNHLISKGVLTETDKVDSDIPLRLDFIMADSKKGIVGNEETVVTNVNEAKEILTDVIENKKITNINVGLHGWQKGGESLSKPYQTKFSRNIGTKNKFKTLIKEFSDKSVDISFARNYIDINRQAISYQNNAVRHVNSWYLDVNKRKVLPENSPVFNFGYATPKKSIKWFNKQLDRFSDISTSMTVSGISNVLLSNYNRDKVDITVTDAIALYEESFKKANEKTKLNFENPNMYLWKYTDRYLQAPIGTSQYVYETDAVPFLQMVLSGTMEVYAPYSNFSFYTQSDILKMIDYNISPSFILSSKPSHLLSSTTSADLYSTEYFNYENLIEEVYSKVNDSLRHVIAYRWIGRDVLENGIIRNIYINDDKEIEIIINYTDSIFNYKGNSIDPLSASTIKDGEVQ